MVVYGRTRRTDRFALVLVLFGAVLCASSGAWADDKLDIDFVDPEGFDKTGTMTIYMDVLDDEYNVISEVDAAGIEIYIDDKPVPGEITLQTASEANDWVAVAALMAGHRAYAPLEETEDNEGEAIDTGPNIFDLQKQGFMNFIEKLEGNDRISVFMYNELGLKVIDNWSEDHSTAAARVKKNAQLLTADERGKITAPPLYKVIKEVVENKILEAENLPRRKILLIMSDGLDALVFKEKKLATRIDAIVEAARTAQVKVFAVGYTTAMEEGLLYLQDLANKTDGIYRQLPTKDADNIPLFLENIATQLKKQYVVTFKPTDDWSPPGDNKSVKIMMKVTTGTGRTLEDEYPEPVRVPEKPFDAMPIIIWSAVGLGSLLFLFILFKIIKAMANRPKAAPVVVEEEGYSGPYKGKLTCTEGPAAGHEFFLIEDVTTIGAIDGNSIVLPVAGVSKRHAGIKIEEMRFELADFGSTNGTLVNGNKITKQFLRDGDEIRIGECVMRFSLK